MRSFIGKLLIAAFAVGALLPLASPAAAETVIVRETDTAAKKTPERRPFVLTNMYGQAMTDRDLLGSYALLFFGYTFCPDICPTSLQTISVVLEELGPDADKVKPLFISVDPKRDTPQVLRDYTSLFDKRIIGLTGPKPFIDAVVASYNMKYEIVGHDKDDPNNYLIDHSASIAFVGPDGKLITRFGYGMTAEYIATRMREIMAAQTN